MTQIQPEEYPQETSVVLHDGYDQEAYHQAQQIHPRLREISHFTEQQLPTAPPLIEDIFYTLYQPAPRLAQEHELALSATVNRSIVEQMMNTHQWDELRQAGTIGDQFYSGIATSIVAKSVIGSLSREAKARMRELQEAEQAAQELMQEAEALDDIAGTKQGDRAQELYTQAEDARKQAQQELEKAEQAKEELEQDAEAIEDAARQAARDALTDAEEEIEATIAAVKSYTQGYDEDAPDAHKPALSLKEKVQLATKVGQSEKLKQVAELCGRMTRIALACQKVRVLHPPDEVVGITIGDSLSKVLPAELALLADPDLEMQFYRKYYDQSLMQIDMRGSEKQGRGPIIAALDSSGSMTMPLGTSFSKEAWAKAVMLALLAIARKQKRDFACLHFSGTGQLKKFVFAKGQTTPQEIMATTDFFFGGLTQYQGWMQEALSLIESSMFEKADVICLSDGDVYIPSDTEADWNRRRKAKGMRCYSVLLGDKTGAIPLGRISDAIATIDNLAQDTKALEMMFSI